MRMEVGQKQGVRKHAEGGVEGEGTVETEPVGGRVSDRETSEKRSKIDREWHVNRAIRALPQSLLLSTEEGRSKYGQLIQDILVVLRSWSRKWAGRREWQSFLNRKSFLHEVEEAVVPLAATLGQARALRSHETTRRSAKQGAIKYRKRARKCIIKKVAQKRRSHAQRPRHMRRRRRAKRKTRRGRQQPGLGVKVSQVDVFDLCCGKGFFAMLLSHLASLCPALRVRVRRIVIVEKNKKVKWTHIHASNQELEARTRARGDEAAASGVPKAATLEVGEHAPTIKEGAEGDSGCEKHHRELMVCAGLPIAIWAGENIHSETFAHRLRHGQLTGSTRCPDTGKTVEHRADRHEDRHHCNVPKATARGKWTRKHPRVILIGIHLCRRLSSRFVELANALGPKRLVLSVLAPCCLPGPRSIVRVGQRVWSRHAAKSSPTRSKDWNACWTCGGPHMKQVCPIKQTGEEQQSTRVLDSCELAVGLLEKAENPFETWCDFLCEATKIAPAQHLSKLDVPLRGRCAHGGATGGQVMRSNNWWNESRRTTWLCVSPK